MFISIPRKVNPLIKPPAGTQINWSDPINQGLVASYLFNEGGGTNLLDGINGTYTATINTPASAAWVSTGLHGLALAQSGTAANYITMPRINLNTTGPWTWEGYAQPTSNTANHYSILCSAGTAGTFLRITIKNTAGGVPQLDVYISGDYISSVNLTVNNWYHLAVTTVGTTQLKYYINGVNTDTVSATTNWGTVTGPNALCSAASSQAFLGNVSYQRFWTRSLTASEIQRLYQAPFGNMLAPKLYSVDVPAVGGTVQPIFNSAALLMHK